MLVLLQVKLRNFIPNDEQTYLLGMAYRWEILVEHNPERVATLDYCNDNHGEAALLDERAVTLYNACLIGDESLDLTWFYANNAVVSICRRAAAELK